MKTKRFNQKLSLSKQTIAHLDAASMGKVKGGACTWTPTGCSGAVLCCTIGDGFNPNTCGTYYYCPPISDPGNPCPA